MKLADVLVAILQSLKLQHEISPSKTRLLKLAYLCDVEHARRHKTRLSDANWVYYLYGPYDMGYEETLRDPRFETKEADMTDGGTATLVETDAVAHDLDFDAQRVVSYVVREYGRMPLNDLLDEVYFDSEPMMAAERRGERLDFSTIKPESYYNVRNLRVPPKAERQIRKEFRQRVRSLRGERSS